MTQNCCQDLFRTKLRLFFHSEKMREVFPENSGMSPNRLGVIHLEESSRCPDVSDNSGDLPPM